MATEKKEPQIDKEELEQAKKIVQARKDAQSRVVMATKEIDEICERYNVVFSINPVFNIVSK
jgi:hypothetical protein